MKIIVVHGDDVVSARARFAEIISSVKKKSWQVVNLTSSDSFRFSERLSSNSLFPQKTLYLFENLNKLPKAELDWLTKHSEKYDGNLLIFNRSEASASLKKSFPSQTKFEEFKLPKVIFKFLESFYPGNSKATLKLLHECLDTENPEFVFALLARQLRDLYWVKTDKRGLSYQSWRIGKLESQASRFSENGLKIVISNLANIDVASKTSDADLAQNLDLLIARELK